MSLADIIRGGVAIANSVTKTGKLQETITLKRWISQDTYAVPTYAAGLMLSALVEHRHKRLRTTSGAEIVSTAQVTILGPIPAVSPIVASRHEPVDERDQVILADGSTGPIVGVDGGLTDPSTPGRGYLTQIMLG